MDPASIVEYTERNRFCQQMYRRTRWNQYSRNYQKPWKDWICAEWGKPPRPYIEQKYPLCACMQYMLYVHEVMSHRYGNICVSKWCSFRTLNKYFIRVVEALLKSTIAQSLPKWRMVFFMPPLLPLTDRKWNIVGAEHNSDFGWTHHDMQI